MLIDREKCDVSTENGDLWKIKRWVKLLLLF